MQNCVRKTSPEICTEPAFAYRVRDNTLYEDHAAGKNALDSVYGAMYAHHGEECDLAVLDIWRFIPSDDKEQTRYASNVDFWGELQCRLGENFKWVGLSEVAQHGVDILNQSAEQTILQPVSPSVPSDSIQTHFENSMAPIGQPIDRTNGDHDRSTIHEPPSTFKLPSIAVKHNRIQVWISECSNGVLCLQPDDIDAMAAYHEQLTDKVQSLPPHRSIEIGTCGVAEFDGGWFRAIVIETEPVPKAYFPGYGNSAEIEKGRFLQDQTIFQQNLFTFPIRVSPHLEESINSLGQQSLNDPDRWNFMLEISGVTMHDIWKLPLVTGNIYVIDRDLPEKRLEDYLDKVRFCPKYFIFIFFV